MRGGDERGRRGGQREGKREERENGGGSMFTT